MNRHVLPAYTWVSFSLWLAFPTIMTFIATIAAFIIAATVTYITYLTDTNLTPVVSKTLTFSDLIEAAK